MISLYKRLLFSCLLSLFATVAVAATPGSSESGPKDELKSEQKGDLKIKPEKEPVQTSIAILGDSLADGLYIGMVQLSRINKNLSVKKYSRVNTGITRYDRYDWTSAAEEISKEDKSDVYLLMFGANDLQSIREESKRYHFPSEEWGKRYVARIDDITKALKKTERKIYWVGLPIVGKKAYAEGYKHLNSLFATRAAANGVTFIDSWDWFASEEGDFQASGEGADGKKKLLRAKDMVHFTGAGYVDLATYVAREIKLIQ
ncbi:GDSL-type esterase/lipase family protein [uncultured Cohaesibacter sp.]|uniref:SGNH/GDSL hydrolase family protein n=1 Tax=uncultured Cohaesibacter sp. TaxID=1002546 RepID=UPI00292EAFCB|nr:GDSL-type esterase/lipase family protein [uncultured Cohaesibacter sp.]